MATTVSIQTPFAEKPGVPFPWSTRVKSGVGHGGDANGAGLRLVSSRRCKRRACRGSPDGTFEAEPRPSPTSP